MIIYNIHILDFVLNYFVSFLSHIPFCNAFLNIKNIDCFPNLEFKKLFYQPLQKEISHLVAASTILSFLRKNWLTSKQALTSAEPWIKTRKKG